MGGLWEMIFCPIHGVFAPANWQAMLPLIPQIVHFITRREKT